MGGWGIEKWDRIDDGRLGSPESRRKKIKIASPSPTTLLPGTVFRKDSSSRDEVKQNKATMTSSSSIVGKPPNHMGILLKREREKERKR